MAILYAPEVNGLSVAVASGAFVWKSDFFEKITQVLFTLRVTKEKQVKTRKNK
jgi:hypothetical protein